MPYSASARMEMMKENPPKKKLEKAMKEVHKEKEKQKKK